MTNESRRSLERQLAELSEEIRHYPTPIARCDEQLADLLERRARVLAELRSKQDEPAASGWGCTQEGIWSNDGGFDAA
jgi:chromosome segregation ATPase